MKPNTTPPTAAKDEQVVFAYVHKFQNIAYASSLALRPPYYTSPYPSTSSGVPQYARLDKLDNKDGPVFAITNDKHQTEQGRQMEESCGFYRLLVFSGAYGNPLSLWVKPRVGDKKSTRGPLVKPIKNKATSPLARAGYVGFAGCCGADVALAAEIRSEHRAVRLPTDHQHFPGCLGDDITGRNSFLLCEESKEDVLDTLKDTGFIPLYRYSTPEGAAFLMLFRTSGRGDIKQSPLLYGRTEKPVLSIIKRLQGIKQ